MLSNRYFLAACSIILLLVSCKKDRQNGFPEETKTGANTFGCYIDNAVLIPCKKPSMYPGERLKANWWFYDTSHIDLGISAVDDCDRVHRSFQIVFDSMDIAANTMYKFSDYSDTTGNTVKCSYRQDLVEYYSDSSLSGTVTVTNFDKNYRIISGKFEVRLQEFRGARTVSVTKGRFDVTF